MEWAAGIRIASLNTMTEWRPRIVQRLLRDASERIIIIQISIRLTINS